MVFWEEETMFGFGKKGPAAVEIDAGAKSYQAFIGGEWRSMPAHFDDINPTTRQVLARAPDCTAADVDTAIAAAHAAQPGWEALPPAARADLFYKAAELFITRQQEFCDALVAETGSGFGKAMFECSLVPLALREAAALATRTTGEIMPSNVPGKVNTAQRKAAGVVGVISPWNFPLYLSLRGFIYGMALGNTAVLKPSEDSPLTGGLMIASLFEDAGFPKGTLNVVTCSRDRVAEIGDKLISDPRVARISFTGSTAVGREVAKACAAQFKRVILEMGGKNPIVVLDDADVDQAVNIAFFGAFMHQGQICMSTERIILHEAIADGFIAKFVERARGIIAGDTRSQQFPLGPVINEFAAARIRALINDAVSKGAEVLCGGDMHGNFLDATVLDRVTPAMRVYEEETFGPLAVLLRAGSDDEAVTIANASEYGLSSAVFSRDVARALSIAKRIESGICHINGATVADEPQMPFGGVKASGYGRFGGVSALDEFTELRWISIESGPSAYPI